MYLAYKGVEMDNSTFHVEFAPPQNFSSYRDLDLNTQRATLFTSLEAVPYLSQQFKMQKYLGLTQEEMKENEEYWKEENKYNENSQEYLEILRHIKKTEELSQRNLAKTLGFSLGKFSFNNLNLSALIGEKDWVINLLGDKFNYDNYAIVENLSLNQLEIFKSKPS